MANRRYASIVVVLALALLLAACGQESVQADDEAAVTVEQVGDSELARITLSEHAVQRLAVQTAAVEEATVGGERHKVVPHAAVIWDSSGQAWTYAALEAHVYMRAPIAVLRIDGDAALLSDGPEIGTQVVVVGAPELWGAETGVGGGH